PQSIETLEETRRVSFIARLKFSREVGIFVGFVFLFIMFSVLSPHFLNFGNVMDIALQSSINAILAIGMTYIIITSGIDLSIGSALALSGFFAADLMMAGEGPIVGLAVG